MEFRSLRLWIRQVIILAILFFNFLGCLSKTASFPTDIHNNHLIRPHSKWVQPKGALPASSNRSSRSDLDVSASQVNGTAEANLLLEFRRGITVDEFNVLSSWNSTNVSNYCTWFGVNCSGPRGPVGALNLSGHQLIGTISPALCGLQFLSSLNISNNYFEGPIPTGIANCSNLASLDLSSNEVTGSIPGELSSLSNLEELNLSGNQLTGFSPLSFSNLSALRVLNLAANQMQGGLAEMDWGALSRLHSLNLSSNQFAGSFPEALGNCTSLLTVDLSGNLLTGIIPDMFRMLPKLQYLDVGSNTLAGPLPQSLGSLKALQVLSLSFNDLTGSIPDSLLNCSSLTTLLLDGNQLGGEIPSQIGLLSSLQYLDLSGNNLTGSIPDSLLNCLFLTGLILNSNRLVGEIPSDIGVLSRLESLNLASNNLTGSIPPSLTTCEALTEIIVSCNSLGGELPEEMGTLSELRYLDLSYNSFTSQDLAFLGNATNLIELQLQSNSFISTMPDMFGRLNKLTGLDLSSNFFMGDISPTLSYATALISLNLAANTLSPQIPASLGELVNLQILNLSKNYFAGSIPAELSRCGQLAVLDLSSNLLTGSVPFELAALDAMDRLYLNNNNLTGAISSALRQMSTSLTEINLAYNSFNGSLSSYDFGSVASLQLSLDLSHNWISGPLPSGIGALQYVQKINLSFNSFSGPITAGFNQCAGLESLDLSSNDLDGNIPESLPSLDKLSFFNVSYNQLTGAVPDWGQFAKFTNASYLGNPGLCGPMLPQKCGSSCSGIRCHKLWLVIISAVATGLAVALALGGIWYLFTAKTGNSRRLIAPAVPNTSPFSNQVGGLSLGEIMAATNGFSESSIVGVGSKSKVFAGVLPSGVMIAVKRLDMKNNDKGAGQLYRELQRLSKLEHPNLLKVYGLFFSGDLKALALEYMPNGSLRTQMYEGTSCRLTWVERLNIALGVAEAMVHLHCAGSKPVVHMDLKPSNILLDASMKPKVADYGIFRHVNHQSQGDTTISSNLYGTIGYIPPEYGAMRTVSTMGDVYNFGVILMELFTRKQPTDDMFGQEVSLRSWVAGAFPGRISQILDSTLRQELARKEQDVGIHLFVRLAIACTRNSLKDRPTMLQARNMLLEIKSTGQPCKGSK